MTAYYSKQLRAWSYDFMLARRRYTKAGFSTRKAARSAEAERRKEEQKGRTAVFSTFGELIDDYLLSSERTKSPQWVYQLKKKLNKAYGNLDSVPLHELRRGHFEKVLNDLYRAGAKPRTVNEYRKLALAVLNYGVRLEALERNPAAGIGKLPEADANVRPIETAHLKALILAADGATGLPIANRRTLGGGVTTHVDRSVH